MYLQTPLGLIQQETCRPQNSTQLVASEQRFCCQDKHHALLEQNHSSTSAASMPYVNADLCHDTKHPSSYLESEYGDDKISPGSESLKISPSDEISLIANSTDFSGKEKEINNDSIGEFGKKQLGVTFEEEGVCNIKGRTDMEHNMPQEKLPQKGNKLGIKIPRHVSQNQKMKKARPQFMRSFSAPAQCSVFRIIKDGLKNGEFWVRHKRLSLKCK